MPGSKVAECSVIVPVLREAGRVASLLEELRAMAFADAVRTEIVVVDGDPAGSTLTALDGLAADWLDADAANQADVPGREDLAWQGVHLLRLHAGPGRAEQMNAGARAASGEALLFLHADTRLPQGALARVREVLELGFAQAGAFDLRFDASGPRYSLIASLARLRSRLERCPYGDQAHFFARAVFFGLGGYPEIPIMEDVELMHALRRRGMTLCILPDRATTSARRYRADGPLRRALGNLVLRAAHGMGADPARLARRYRGKSDHGQDKDRS